MDTVGEIIPLVRKFVGDSGECDDTKVLAAINAVRSLLWNKTDYLTTMEYIRICCTNGLFYLPPTYKQIKLGWIGSSSSELGDEWYQSLQGGSDSFYPSQSCHKRIVDTGEMHPIYRNYTTAPYQLIVQPESTQDQDIRIVVLGQNEYGTNLREEMVLGERLVGNRSEFRYNSVTGVIKPQTNGRVRLYAYNPDNGEKLQIAIYQPYDVNPSFRKFRIHGGKTCSLRLYVKKRCAPLVTPDDLVEFPVDSIIFALTAVSCRDNRDSKGFAENMGLALNELRNEQTEYEQPVAGRMGFEGIDTVESNI